MAVIAAGCGRLHFGVVDDGDGGTSTGDATEEDNDADTGGVPATSCMSLAANCGASASLDCCHSILVPAGTFHRSYDTADGMFPDMSNPATVSDFRLDKFEVTVGRFRAFVMAGKGTQANPPALADGERGSLPGWDSAWNSQLENESVALSGALNCGADATWTPTAGANETRPMNCLLWYEAAAFCAWDGGWLPTEAEWNYAAAGGDEQRARPWSNPPDTNTISDTQASFECNGDGLAGCVVADLIPVGSRSAGNGRWAHADMVGNVWEWVLDYYQATYPNPCMNCAELTPMTERAARGASWSNPSTLLRSAARNSYFPDMRDTDFGVRCARAP